MRRVISECKVCAELKPNFFKPLVSHLIKAMQPFERLNVDFKGPLPTSNRNSYLLTIVDEFTRFSFAFACPDMTSATIIGCFNQLFAIFGMAAYIHSDRGTSFMSAELVHYLTSKGIATSRTTPYNPRGNGQTERYNGIIWNAVKLALRTKQMHISQWNSVLQDALHSIRSLLCTATGETPHERLFNFQRRSSSGYSIPSWLSSPGKVLLRRHVRPSKNDPLVDEVDLLHANPSYALVRFPGGKEDTVSIRDLAPCARDAVDGVQDDTTDDIPNTHDAADSVRVDTADRISDTANAPDSADADRGPFPESTPVRRSQREKRQPERYGLS